MGYYSDTLLVFSNSGRKDFYKFIRENSTEMQNEVRSFLRCASKIKIKNGSLLFYWENYKWDDGYQFVSFLYDFLKSINKQNYLFVRYGERVNDIEMLGNYESKKGFDMKFSRNIIVDDERYY